MCVFGIICQLQMVERVIFCMIIALVYFCGYVLCFFAAENRRGMVRRGWYLRACLLTNVRHRIEKATP